MKKVIFAALLMASIGTLSSFKSNTLKLDTANKKDIGQADDQKNIGQADDQKNIGQADAHKRSTLNDKKDIGQAD